MSKEVDTQDFSKDLEVAKASLTEATKSITEKDTLIASLQSDMAKVVAERDSLATENKKMKAEVLVANRANQVAQAGLNAEQSKEFMTKYAGIVGDETLFASVLELAVKANKPVTTTAAAVADFTGTVDEVVQTQNDKETLSAAVAEWAKSTLENKKETK